ncbi:MAG TPA: hypothetical protein EYP53_09040 [Candidatus Latescibacteria bacterium]|nr:hypothetical protein [Candidatus Latescibacterota bacterium]
MQDEKIEEIFRCPYCLAKEVDISLLFDEAKGEYYCVRCCFVGTKQEVFEACDRLIPHPKSGH